MASTDRQISANRQNALKSTGPRSGKGKAVVSTNAVRHGLLSQKLVLPGESQTDFDQLLDSLVSEMRPQGSIEHVLVERIAIAMWRQRRLVAAETAQLNLARQENHAGRLRQVLEAAQLNESSAPWVSSMLDAPPMVAEIQALLNDLEDVQPGCSISDIRRQMPSVWAQLCAEAECHDLNVANTESAVSQHAVTNYHSLDAWISTLRTFQREMCRAATAIEWVRDSAALRPVSETVSRYQSSLDNELFKALRALREAQAAHCATL